MAGLGKGLGALLDDTAVKHIEQGVSEGTLPVAQLVPSDAQPRHYFDQEALDSLAASIKEQGVIQPLLVRPKPGTEGVYEIIAGERRWRASKLVGLKEVPVIIRELSDNKALEVALVENIQRSDLNPVDEAQGYLRLVNEYNYTHEEMGRVTGKSRSHISNMIRILSLPDRCRDLVAAGELSMGHGRALLPLSDNPELQLRVASKIMKKDMSVREAEDAVRSTLRESGAEPKTKTNKSKDAATRELESRIEKDLGVQCNIRQKGGRGSIRFNFENEQQLADVLTRLGF